jgi:hypothetical protein
LELSKAQEDGKWTWQGLEEAIQLSATAGSGHITCHRQSTRIRRRRSLLGRTTFIDLVSDDKEDAGNGN